MVKKLLSFLSILTVLTALVGLIYYFFKLNPEYSPFCGCEDDELV